MLHLTSSMTQTTSCRTTCRVHNSVRKVPSSTNVYSQSKQTKLIFPRISTAMAEQKKFETKSISSSSNSSVTACPPRKKPLIKTVTYSANGHRNYCNLSNNNNNNNNIKSNVIVNTQKRSLYSDNNTNPRNSNKNNKKYDRENAARISYRNVKKYKEEDEQTECAYSDKFPSGLPFEQEFYKNRSYSNYSSRCTSSSIENHNNNNNNNNKQTNNNNNNNNNYIEDEFNRKPSNEPLYVDFSKSVPTKTTQHHNHHHHYHNYNGNVDDRPIQATYSTSHENNFYKFERISRYYNGNEYIIHEEPVLYLAVASWIPKCNQSIFEAKALEPTKNDIIDNSSNISRRRLLRSKRSNYNRTANPNRKLDKYRNGDHSPLYEYHPNNESHRTNSNIQNNNRNGYKEAKENEYRHQKDERTVHFKKVSARFIYIHKSTND